MAGHLKLNTVNQVSQVLKTTLEQQSAWLVNSLNTVNQVSQVLKSTLELSGEEVNSNYCTCRLGQSGTGESSFESILEQQSFWNAKNCNNPLVTFITVFFLQKTYEEPRLMER